MLTFQLERLSHSSNLNASIQPDVVPFPMFLYLSAVLELDIPTDVFVQHGPLSLKQVLRPFPWQSDQLLHVFKKEIEQATLAFGYFK